MKDRSAVCPRVDTDININSINSSQPKTTNPEKWALSCPHVASLVSDLLICSSSPCASQHVRQTFVFLPSLSFIWLCTCSPVQDFTESAWASGFYYILWLSHTIFFFKGTFTSTCQSGITCNPCSCAGWPCLFARIRYLYRINYSEFWGWGDFSMFPVSGSFVFPGRERVITYVLSEYWTVGWKIETQKRALIEKWLYIKLIRLHQLVSDHTGN